MGITSLQVCMESSDWLQQGTISEEGAGMESSSPITTPTGDEMLTCSRPIIERRLRPQHEQAQKCPRCESTHTKFCYYNNYSLSQPRYFCKTCRRYWTKGGTLRNIPVGGGCRKNKKSSSKKSAADHPPSHSPSPSSSLLLNQHISSYNDNPTDLQLAFPDQIQFSSLHAGLYPTGGTTPFLLDGPTPIDFMESKYEALLGGSEGFGGMMAAAPPTAASFQGCCSPFGLPMVPYESHQNDNRFDEIEVKPNPRVLSIEWHDHQQACNSDAGKDSFGYNFGGLGSWSGLMNGYGSSATNPLV